jgi:hypothetical protein
VTQNATETTSAEEETYDLLGFKVSASAAFIGDLIQHQTQLDLIIDQLWAVHKRDTYSAKCACGLPKDDCRSRPILEAYRRARKGKS